MKHSILLDSLESTINNAVTQYTPPLKLVLREQRSTNRTEFRFLTTNAAGRKRLSYYGYLRFLQSPCDVIRMTDVMFVFRGQFFGHVHDTENFVYVGGDLRFTVQSDDLIGFMDTVNALAARKLFPTLDDVYAREVQVRQFNDEGPDERLNEDEVKELHGIV